MLSLFFGAGYWVSDESIWGASLRCGQDKFRCAPAEII
jgi:hypothetical protein